MARTTIQINLEANELEMLKKTLRNAVNTTDLVQGSYDYISLVRGLSKIQDAAKKAADKQALENFNAEMRLVRAGQ